MVHGTGPNFATVVRHSWPFQRGSTEHAVIALLLRQVHKGCADYGVSYQRRKFVCDLKRTFGNLCEITPDFFTEEKGIKAQFEPLLNKSFHGGSKYARGLVVLN